jgi:hypothetical protein
MAPEMAGMGNGYFTLFSQSSQKYVSSYDVFYAENGVTNLKLVSSSDPAADPGIQWKIQRASPSDPTQYTLRSPFGCASWFNTSLAGGEPARVQHVDNNTFVFTINSVVM